MNKGQRYVVYHGADLEPFMEIQQSGIESLFGLVGAARWAKDDHEHCVREDKESIRQILRLQENWKHADLGQSREADLFARRKNDAVKLELAARLRRETTLSTKTIAARMHLGSSKAANRSWHRYLRGGALASAGQGQLGI